MQTFSEVTVSIIRMYQIPEDRLRTTWGFFVWLWLNQLLCCHTHLLHIVAALLYDIAIHSIPYTITVRFKRQYTILNGKHRKANRAISTSIEITIHCHDLGRVETFREVDEISY